MTLCLVYDFPTWIDYCSFHLSPDRPHSFFAKSADFWATLWIIVACVRPLLSKVSFHVSFSKADDDEKVKDTSVRVVSVETPGVSLLSSSASVSFSFCLLFCSTWVPASLEHAQDLSKERRQMKTLSLTPVDATFPTVLEHTISKVVRQMDHGK